MQNDIETLTLHKAMPAEVNRLLAALRSQLIEMQDQIDSSKLIRANRTLSQLREQLTFITNPDHRVARKANSDLQPADREMLIQILGLPASQANRGLKELADARLAGDLESIEERLGAVAARELAVRVAQIPFSPGHMAECRSLPAAVKILEGELLHLDPDRASGLNRKPDPVHTPRQNESRGGGVAD